MKLLFISADPIPHVGGKSSHVESLISRYRQEGIECDLFCSGAIDTSGRYFYRKIYFKMLRLLSPKVFLYRWRVCVKRAMSKEILKLQKQNHYDAISCQDAISAVCCYRLREEFPRVPVTLTMHTYFGIECTLDGGIKEDSYLYRKIYSFEESSLSYADNVVAVDERIREHMEASIKKHGYKIGLSSIKNFTNTDIFKPSSDKETKKQIRCQYGIVEDDFVGICVRRLVEKNGVKYAVDAFRHIKEEKIKLMILGTGPEMEEIQKIIHDNNLEHQVILCGEVMNDKVLAFYQACDFAVVPSITVNGLQEATSISAIEAMSCGLPTVASAIGGLKEMIVNNKNGLLVNEQAPAEIADAVRELYHNKEKYDGLSEDARKSVVEKYSHISAASEYLRVFMNEKK